MTSKRKKIAKVSLVLREAIALENAIGSVLRSDEPEREDELREVSRILKIPADVRKAIKAKVSRAIDSRRGVSFHSNRLAFEAVTESYEEIDRFLSERFEVEGDRTDFEFYVG